MADVTDDVRAILTEIIEAAAEDESNSECVCASCARVIAGKVLADPRLVVLRTYVPSEHDDPELLAAALVAAKRAAGGEG